MRKYIIVAALLFMGAYAYSQSNSDLGSWTAIQFNKKVSRGYAFFRGECRTMDNMSQVEAWFMAAGGGFNFTKWLKADLSYEFWKTPCLENNPTIHKGVLAVTGTLKRDALSIALREKYEFAYNPYTSTTSNTLRSRLRGDYKIGRFTPYLMYEHFLGLEGEGWIRSLHYAGTEISVGKKHSFDIFYMYHLYNSTDNVSCSRHIIGLGYNFSF